MVVFKQQALNRHPKTHKYFTSSHERKRKTQNMNNIRTRSKILKHLPARKKEREHE